MPRISEEARITKKYDKRIKLTDNQRGEIVQLHADGYGLRELGRMYQVDKVLIKGIIDPEWKAKQAQMNIERQRIYREKLKNSRELKDKRNEDMRRHREYKDLLFKKGLIEISKK